MREWVLPYYLRSIYELEYDKRLIDIYWIVNNSTDNSYEMLREFKQKYHAEYRSIKIEIINSNVKFEDDRNDYIRKTYTYEWLSALRNKIMDYCVSNKNDYLFSSDSDIILKKDTLTRLVEHDKQIVSSLIYNGYIFLDIENAYKYTNVLNNITNTNYVHKVNFRTKFPEKNPYGMIISCSFTGACVLMTREVCSKTRYAWHEQGEDEFWSRTAKNAGFNLWCDISLFNYHAMEQSILDYFVGKGFVEKI